MRNSCVFSFAVAALAAAGAPTSGAQQVERDVAVLSEEIAGRLDGFSYREGPESSLEFRGTSIALGAEGEAEVEFQEGRARVDVEVDKLPPPSSLGPFSTYVVWAVAADGVASNLGSIEMNGDDGELEATTPLSRFALIVSAEPHFAVSAPSRAVVLQNLGKRVRGEKFIITGLRERMDYSGISPQPSDQGIPSELKQARYAIAIAEGADADRLAQPDYERAEQLLREAEAATKDEKRSVRNTAPQLARNAVQAGEAARRRAVLAVAAEQQEAIAAAARTEAEKKAAVEAAAAAEAAKVREAQVAEEAALAANRAARADLVARLNRVLPTRETSRGIVAEIAGVQFAIGKAGLNPDAKVALARFAGIVGIYPSMRFRVEGHTDSTGSDETNRALSLARASSVRDYLVGLGVESERISVVGLGPDQPVADNSTAQGRARNRRVEIILTGDPIAAS
ncbi:MAG TPA: OmpA family protein [Steroidobacteraceae bacterium]|nr:OmpA family protein [Steroidobacteraceae bacterium]